jgi:TolA-binding protein
MLDRRDEMDADHAEPSGEIVALDAARDRADHADDEVRALELRALELEGAKTGLEEIVTRLESELRDARGRIAELTGLNEHLEAAHVRAVERERVLVALEARLEAMRKRDASAGPRRDAPAGLPGRRAPSASASNGFLRALSQAAPASVLQPAALELASRRFAKLRRDPKLFLAHSRFELARKLSRLL